MTNLTGVWYARAYFNFATLPSAANTFFAICDNGAVRRVWLTISSTGAVQLNDEDGTIGSPSSPLSTGTWYRIEVKFDNTAAAGSHVVELRIDGVSIASATNRNISTGITNFQYGGNIGTEAQTTGTWYIDDLAINDNTGTSQTSWPGSGKIIHLRPNAAGDAAGFVRQGTDSGANYSQVNEVTPNDLTQYVNSTTLNAEDLYNVDNSGLSASDTVTLVQVGVRYRGNSSTAVPTFVLEAMKTSGGTVAQGSAITPNATTWSTNANQVPRNYTLTLYNDPDGAAWTNATLDSMQIGMKLTVDNTNRDDISTVWALVEYVPSTGTPNAATFFPFF